MSFFLIFCFLGTVSTFYLENGIDGGSNIECHPDSVDFAIYTNVSVEVNTYVRDHPSCRQNYEKNSNMSKPLNVPFGDCGMTRMNTSDPRVYFVHINFVANFYPGTEMETDREFDLRCYYANTRYGIYKSIYKSEFPAPKDENIDKKFIDSLVELAQDLEQMADEQNIVMFMIIGLLSGVTALITYLAREYKVMEWMLKKSYDVSKKTTKPTDV